MSGRAASVAAAVLGLLAAPLATRAQTPRSAQPPLPAAPAVGARAVPRVPTTAAECDSLLARARVDSTIVEARAYLERTDGEPLPDSLAAAIVDAIASRLELPTPLTLTVFAPGPARLGAMAPVRPRDSVATRAPVLNGVYRFVLRRDGRVERTGVALAALAMGVDSAFVRAIARAARDSVLPRPPRSVAPRSGIPLTLRIAVGVPARGVARPIFRALVWRVPLVDAAPPRVLPTPPYPDDDDVEDDWEGNVLLQFVVDRTGTPLVETAEVLQPTALPFVRAAVATLAQLRFAPAHVGACPVYQMARLTMEFRTR